MRKVWLMNIGLALVCLLVAIWLVFLGLNWYTRHNVSVEVPSLVGVSYEDAIKKLDDADLRYEIFDSVYNADFRKNAITEQDPPAKLEVKPGRVIYLTINALAKPKVKMPKLVDQSMALGKAVLKNAGLVLGEVTYTYDQIGHNLVIEQLYKGAPIMPGRLIEKGSVIDLVVSTNKGASNNTDSTNISDNPETNGDGGSESIDQEPGKPAKTTVKPAKKTPKHKH